MPSRTFADHEGRRWRVHLIEPAESLGERRVGGDRRHEGDLTTGGAVGAVSFDPPLLERRASDRRVVAAPSRRTGLPPAWEGGWLLFEPAQPAAGQDEAPREAGLAPGVVGGRRRLAPVPPEWLTCPEAALVALLERAAPVRNSTGRAAPGLEPGMAEGGPA